MVACGMSCQRWALSIMILKMEIFSSTCFTIRQCVMCSICRKVGKDRLLLTSTFDSVKYLTDHGSRWSGHIWHDQCLTLRAHLTSLHVTLWCSYHHFLPQFIVSLHVEISIPHIPSLCSPSLQHNPALYEPFSPYASLAMVGNLCFVDLPLPSLLQEVVQLIISSGGLLLMTEKDEML